MTDSINVEILVQAHTIARRRIRRGQSPWEGKLNFLPKLTAILERLNEGDDTLTAQMVLDTIHAAAKEVRLKVPQAQSPITDSANEGLEYFLDVFEGFTLERVDACPCLDDALEPAMAHLYDWADIHRWWITPFEFDTNS